MWCLRLLDAGLLVVLVAALNVLGADVLPLAAAVDVVPKLVHAGIVGHLEAESSTEDNGEHGVVLAEQGVVDEAGHCEEAWCLATEVVCGRWRGVSVE